MKLDNSVLEYLKGFFLPRQGNSTLGGNVTPSASDSYSLGSPSRRFDTIYTRVLIADNVSTQGGTSDTVDGFHAYATPQPNALLALDVSSVYPISVYPQALLVDGSRALTGNLAVNSGITIDGVDISVHAGDATKHHNSGMSADDHTQYVHNTLARTIQAVHSFSPASTSAPFTLGANAQGQLVTSFNADQTDGFHLNQDVRSTASPSFVGLSVDSPTLVVDSVNHRLGVGVASPATKLHVMANTGEPLRLGFDASNYASLRVSGGGVLTLAPTGDIEFDPAGNDVMPATGYDLNLGSLAKKFLTLHAAELWVETLVAQDTLATLGGRILVAPTTTLTRDLAPADTTMYVKHNSIRTSDVVILQANGLVEFIQATSEPTATGTDYSYSVTRNLDTTGANQWYAGDALVNTGQAGSGFIDMYSFESINGLALDYIYNYDASLAAFSANFAADYRWTLFEVSGSTPAISDLIYFGVSGKTWETLHFFITTAGSFAVSRLWEYWNGSTWSLFSVTESSNFLTTTGYHSVTWDKSVLAGAGWTTTTVNSVSAYWVRMRIASLTSWTTSPVQGERRVRAEKTHWGPTIVGNVRNTSTFNDWSEAWAIGNLNGLYGYGTDISAVGLGKYSASSSYLTIDATNGIRMYSSGTLRTQLSAGILTLNDSTGAAVFTFNASAGAEFTKPLTLGTSGGIYQGSGSFTTPTTGLKIWNDTGTGRIGGFNGGTLQWYANTDGRLYAGGGKVTLDSNGVTLTALTYPSSAYLMWKTDDSNVKVGEMIGSYAGALTNSGLIINGFAKDSSVEGLVSLGAYGDTGTLRAAFVIDTRGRATVDLANGNIDAANTQAITVKSNIATGNVMNIMMYLDTNTKGTPALGLGTAISYRAEDSAGNMEELGYAGFKFTDATNASEDSQFVVATRVAGAASAEVFFITNDVYTDAWTNYSSTSTVVGWSTTTTKEIYYKKIGKLVFISFRIIGTSNSTSTTFTVPYTPSSPVFTSLCRVQDNGGSYAVGLAGVVAGSTTATFFPGVGGGNWTAANQKVIEGLLWYQTT